MEYGAPTLSPHLCSSAEGHSLPTSCRICSSPASTGSLSIPGTARRLLKPGPAARPQPVPEPNSRPAGRATRTRCATQPALPFLLSPRVLRSWWSHWLGGHRSVHPGSVLTPRRFLHSRPQTDAPWACPGVHVGSVHPAGGDVKSQRLLCHIPPGPRSPAEEISHKYDVSPGTIYPTGFSVDGPCLNPLSVPWLQNCDFPVLSLPLIQEPLGLGVKKY